MVCVAILGCSVPSVAAQDVPLQTLTIMADPSLRTCLTLIARKYALLHHISVSTVFGSTKDQIDQIEKGAEAEVLIAARPKWIDLLQQKGLIDVYSRVNVARNRLVLAGSEYELRNINFRTAKRLSDFTDQPDGFNFIMGDPSDTAEGNYGDAALNSYNVTEILKPNTIRYHDSFQMINAISRYHTMGIIFHSDSMLFPEIKEMSFFKPKDHPAIMYQAVVIAGDEMENARLFLTYLSSEEAKHIFKSFGFDPV